MGIYKCDECGCNRDTNEDGYNENDGLIWCDICKDMLDQSILSKDELGEEIRKLLGII